MNGLSVVEVLVGTALGNFLGGFLRAMYVSWLRRRRGALLERRVAAELLSRGFTFDHISLEAIGGPPPGPITDEMVQRTADHCAMFMRLSHMPPDIPSEDS